MMGGTVVPESRLSTNMIPAIYEKARGKLENRLIITKLDQG
jgi:hypothetical protein